MSEMVKFACASCRKVEYEKIETVSYDVSEKTKKEVDMAAFTASRRVAEPLELPFHCHSCQMCYYCSEECQETHYRSVHRLECELFNKIRVLEVNTPDIGLMDLDWDPPHERALLRHLVRIMAKRYEEKCIGSTEATKISHSNSADSGLTLAADPSSYPVTYHEDVYNLIFKTKMSEEHLRIAAEAREILPLAYQPDDPNEFAQVLSRIDCNKFGLFGDRGEVIGSSLHPSASFVNHSCLPNAFSQINGDELKLYTLYPVEAGEELNISYIEPELAQKERRLRLKETYGFDCICRRCARDPAKDSPPKQLYDDFFETHLNCPLCKHGLLMVSDQEDIKDGLEDAKTTFSNTPNFTSLLPSEKKRITSLLNSEPTPGAESYRFCNNCHKLQIRTDIPSVAQFKSTWVDTTPPKKSKKHSRPMTPKTDASSSPLADSFLFAHDPASASHTSSPRAPSSSSSNTASVASSPRVASSLASSSSSVTSSQTKPGRLNLLGPLATIGMLTEPESDEEEEEQVLNSFVAATFDDDLPSVADLPPSIADLAITHPISPNTISQIASSISSLNEALPILDIPAISVLLESPTSIETSSIIEPSPIIEPSILPQPQVV